MVLKPKFNFPLSKAIILCELKIQQIFMTKTISMAKVQQRLAKNVYFILNENAIGKIGLLITIGS